MKLLIFFSSLTFFMSNLTLNLDANEIKTSANHSVGEDIFIEDLETLHFTSLAPHSTSSVKELDEIEFIE